MSLDNPTHVRCASVHCADCFGLPLLCAALHSLSSADAAPPGVRKAILSTNIAETSVTIDGVRFVADSGRGKIMIHDASSRSSALREGWISQASADQRKGRSGRTGPGVCFRLFSQEEFRAMPLATPPEIMRADLEGLVLQLKLLAGEATDPRTFPWLDPPALDSIEQSVFGLRDAGALARDERFTPLGALLANLPVDVSCGKLLVLGSLFHVSGPAVTVAAGMSVSSPFVRTATGSGTEQMRDARAELTSVYGDPFTLLNVFAEWLAVRDEGGAN